MGDPPRLCLRACHGWTTRAQEKPNMQALWSLEHRTLYSYI